MPKVRRKSDLPVKMCTVCNKEMVWRKAWAKTWDDVKYCSDKCRMARGSAGGSRGSAVGN